MKKITLILLTAAMLWSCQETEPTIPSEPVEEEAIDDNTDDDEVIGEENTEEMTIEEAIQSFKESINELRSFQPSPSGRQSNGRTSQLLPKELLVPSHLISGVDIEWLDMADLVLNFAEALNNSSYVLGEETLFFDVLNDPGIWGWHLGQNARVILQYSGNTLYLRVINGGLTQTFFFKYKQDAPPSLARTSSRNRGLINIFRLWETASPEGNRLYIEDFLEKTGMSMWWSNGDYVMTSSVPTKDKGQYTIMSSNKDNRSFIMANYVIDGVPVYILERGNNPWWAMYDFSQIDIFNSFDKDGKLYNGEEEVNMPLNMTTYGPYSDGSYVLTGYKHLDSPNMSLSLPEANITSDITYEDILSNIDSLNSIISINGNVFDYSQPVNAIISSLSDTLYLEY